MSIIRRFIYYSLEMIFLLSSLLSFRQVMTILVVSEVVFHVKLET